MSTATLKMLLLGEDKGASRALNEAGSSAEKAKHGFASATIGLKDMAKGFVGLEVISKATEFIKGSIEAARESQKVNAQTEAVIKSTGMAAGLTGEQFEKMAGRLSVFTGIDHEVIQSGENMLATFTNIKDYVGGKYTGTFDTATQTMLDMSTALGQSTKTSAIQLGKALNDPIKGLTALQRVGVSFTAHQKAQIKTMVEAGKTTDAQRLILGELTKEFGGSAAAQATAGDKAKAAFRELQVAVGTALLPILDKLETKFTTIVVSLTEHLGPVLAKIGAYVSKNKLVFMALAAAVAFLVAPVTTVIAGLVLLYTKSATFRAIVADVADFIMAKVVPALKAFGEYILTTVVPAVVHLAQKIASNLKPIFTTLAQVWQTKVLPALQKLWVKFQQMLPTIQKVIGWVIKMYGKFLEFESKIAGKVIPVVIKLIGWLISKLVPAVINVVSFVVKVVAAFVKFGGALIDGAQKVVSFAGKVATQIGKVVTFFVQLPGKVVKAVGNLGKLLWNAGVAIVQGLLDGIQSKVSSLTSALGHITSLIPKLKGPYEKDKRLLTPAGIAIMDGLIRGIESRKVKLAAVLSKVTGFIQSQNDKIKSLLSEKKGIVDSFKGFGSSVFGASFTDAEGNDAAPTTGGLIGYQSQQLTQAKQLKADVNKLLKMGLSKNLILQMVNAGPSGMANIHALAQGSAADIANLNSLNAQTNATLASVGNTVGGKLYNAQISAATKDRNTAVAIRQEFEKLLKKQDKNTVVELHIDGKVLQVSLLQLKRHNGNRPLGIG